MPRQSAVLSLLAALIVACAHNPAPAAAPVPAAAPATPAPTMSAAPSAPAPAAAGIPDASAPDLTGTWIGTAELPGQSVPVTVILTRGSSGYTGSAAPDGPNPAAPLSTLTLDGPHLVMTFAAPDGEARFDMTLSADRQAMTGNVSYQGQQIAFSARRRH